MREQIVNQEIAQKLAENSDKLNQSRISIIHPEINLKYSSINIFCGRQGKGKSLTIAKEIIKLSKVPSNVHLMIYVNKDGRVDDIYEALKDLITIHYIKVDEIENYLKDLYFKKIIYDKIKQQNWEERIDKEQKREVLDFLYLKDFSLQEIILFDDAAFSKVLMKNNSVVVGMAHEARHYKFIFCFCVQGVKDIPLPLKEQTTTFFLYSGFIRQKLPTIYNQCGIKCIDYQEFKEIYNQLKEKDYLIIDCNKGTFKINDDADLTPLIEYYKNQNNEEEEILNFNDY
jgi:hypothetical protein